MDIIDLTIMLRHKLRCANSKCKFEYFIPQDQSHYKEHYKCPECGKLAIRLITNQEIKNEK